MNLISSDKNFTEKLLSRFLKYVQIYSESDSSNSDSNKFPSTECQKDFAEILRQEMIFLGLQNVELDENCYLYGILPASKGMENEDSFCLLAHLDTTCEVSGKNVNPQVFRNYDGKEIHLKNGIVHDVKKDKYLKMAAENGETVVTTDGTTLLGADDKAGISAIMTAIEYLTIHKEIPHRMIEIMFSPDEETGHGMDRVPLKKIKSKRAYTVDGGHIGELETECFNAFSAEIIFTGKAAHTGNARENKMINAISLASKFITLLPETMLAETTFGYEPFIAPMEIKGNIESSKVHLLLRAFKMEEIENEKQIIKKICESVICNGGFAEIKFNQQYLNMKQKLDENPEVKNSLIKAFKAANATPVENPIRGGTDGSRLTELGLPTPNIFTGAHNFHSRNEWLSLNQNAICADILVELSK